MYGLSQGQQDSAFADKLPYPVLSFDQMMSYGTSSGLSALVCELRIDGSGAVVPGAAAAAPKTRSRHIPAPTDLATIVYTSGTTGKAPIGGPPAVLTSRPLLECATSSCVA